MIIQVQQLKYFFLSNFYYLKHSLLGKQAIETATKYISEIKTPIRFFVTRGPGFGDQVGTLNLIDSLENYHGPIEIIGDYSPTNAESALRKMMTLCNVNSPLINGSLTTELTTGRKVTFFSLDYFKSSTFPNTQLGIFFGVSEGILLDYSPSKFNVNQFTDVARTNEVLLFDPFTVLSMSNNLFTGFALQVHDQTLKRYPSGNLFPYKLMHASPDLIQNELTKYANAQPVKAAILRFIFAEQTANRMNTLTPYGLNIILNRAPEAALFNQIISAAAANIGSNKPLTFTILNNIPNHSWQNLQNFFQLTSPPFLQDALNLIKSKYTINFINALNNETTLSNQPNVINIVNLGEIPNKLFNALLINSTFLASYEGANTATLLANHKKWGFSCQRKKWPMPTDFHINPKELQDAAPFACAENLYAWNKKPTPLDVLTPLYLQYQNETRSTMLSPDRLSLAISELEKNKHSLAAIAFFKPSQNIGAVINLHASSSFEFGIYGALEQFTTECLIRGLAVDQHVAGTLSALMRLSYQFISYDFSVSTFFYAFLLGITMQRANFQLATVLPTALMFFMSNLYHINEFDNETWMLMASLIVTSIIAKQFGKYLVKSTFAKNDHVTIEEVIEEDDEIIEEKKGSALRN